MLSKSMSVLVYFPPPCVEIDMELSFEALNFKRKEKSGEKKTSFKQSENRGCVHTHTLSLLFAVNHTVSHVLSLQQRISFFLLGKWCTILFSHFNPQSRLKGIILLM